MCFTMNSKTENIHLVSYSEYLLRFMYKWMNRRVIVYYFNIIKSNLFKTVRKKVFLYILFGVLPY